MDSNPLSVLGRSDSLRRIEVPHGTAEAECSIAQEGRFCKALDLTFRLLSVSGRELGTVRNWFRLSMNKRREWLPELTRKA
jgi:hypothetical protein